ncbi:RING-H2 finger protein ATL70-like [Alnus glutinosa]|uniref:RING-H2 finger protein ATL70-like n=1 Tax=Alnus glutinosa TaxID=3517 RepID=UPI002D78C3E3|nr:RING-H2 finger protein ATL70-like [Alnus glutinosa]
MDHNKNGLIFAVGFPLSVLLISLFLTIASYLCTPNNDNPSHDDQNIDQNFVAIELDCGLEEATLHSFPKLLYYQFNLKKSSSDSIASCCSICLVDYKEIDVLQLLPGCGHFFHLKCVNPWLRLCPSCPLCWKSLIVAPVVSPLVDQKPPLATQQDQL